MENLLIQNFSFVAIGIALSVLAVIFIFWLLDSSPLSNWFKASEGITASFISVPAFLFGLSISTFSSALWDNHHSASTSLVNESGGVRNVIWAANELPTPDREKLTGALIAYLNSVIDQEWPAMRSGDSSVRDNASPQLDALSDIANAIAMKSNLNPSLLNRLNSAMNTLHHERMQRLFLAYEYPSFIRWPSLFVLSFLLIFTIGLLQLRSPRAMKITLTMGALCIGSSMVFLLANLTPYRGLNAVKPEILKGSLRLIKDSPSSPPSMKQ